MQEGLEWVQTGLPVSSPGSSVAPAISSTGRWWWWWWGEQQALPKGSRTESRAERVPQTQLVLREWAGRTCPHTRRSEAQDAAS